MVVENQSDDTANVKLHYYREFEHYEDDFTHILSFTINPKNQKEIIIEYGISDADNVELAISCIDSTSIMGAKQCYIINESDTIVYNLDYKEFTNKTNNRYKVSLFPEACSNGFSNIGTIKIRENGTKVSIDDTLMIPL